MNKTLNLICIVLIMLSCKDTPKDTGLIKKEVVFNQALADELSKMAELDQVAAYIPQGKHKELSENSWNTFKDSVFTTHEKRLQEIFNTHGFTGYDLVGKEGATNFWLMVQHSDHNPEFQTKVLKQMKIEIENNNADPSDYGLLVDRVLLNTGKAQVYGTQVTYNMNTGQAYPKPLSDSINVNERRKSIHLEPLEAYLNTMTEMHFEMNKDYYLKDKGILEPKLYPIE
ncbi:DUF6624 domain-containing protein [Psychroserpens damuponensis]|uniref:DUF6624 domain-containing protein n=1 Tax=Psychroserpens damuponensis TaxID=943936 RepID=UPI00058BB5F5|nr:DUF6624 domain-containing protein [Psychroserpens damuponensis]